MLIAAGLWTLGALFAGGFLISAAFRDHVETEHDFRLQRVLDSMVGIAELDEDTGVIRFDRELNDQRFDMPYSGWYWQVASLGTDPYRSRSLWDEQLATDFQLPALSQRFSLIQGPEDQILRLLQQDIQFPGGIQPYRFMVAADVAELRDHIARFDKLVIYSLGGLGIGLIAAMILQVTFGLYPLKNIRRGLTAIRTGKAKKLKSDFPPEIMPLVNEMNAVLDQNEEIVERARTQVGNLAHSLKTPLSVIANALTSAKGSAMVNMIDRQTRVIRRQVDYQLSRARAIGAGRNIRTRTEVGPCVNRIKRAIERIYADRGLTIVTEIADGLCFWGERQDLEEILGNLLDNAAKWGKRKIKIKAQTASQSKGKHFFAIVIEDDGPGVSKEKRAELFKRGKRLDESVPGTGLGLDIVRDIVQICGGTIKLNASKLGGLKVTVKLPAVEV